MKIKTINLKQFLNAYNDLDFNDEKRSRMKTYAEQKEDWSALDILALNENFTDILQIILDAKLVPDKILHEFGCICAEQALSFITVPAPRCIAAIKAKQDWLAERITTNELQAARLAIKGDMELGDKATRAANLAVKAVYQATSPLKDLDNLVDSIYVSAFAAVRDAAIEAAHKKVFTKALEEKKETLFGLIKAYSNDETI